MGRVQRWHRKIAVNFNQLSRVHTLQTDDRQRDTQTDL